MIIDNSIRYMYNKVYLLFSESVFQANPPKYFFFFLKTVLVFIIYTLYSIGFTCELQYRTSIFIADFIIAEFKFLAVI